MAKRRDVKIEEKRELATAVPVECEAVYLRQPELREAWVDILALRATKQPIPNHLAINDNLNFTNNRLALRVFDTLLLERTEPTFENARKVADSVIPKA